jgi:hypothetical protein
MSFISDLFLSQEEIARGQELDRKLAELNRRKLEEGRISQATYDEMQRNIERGTTADEYAGEVDQAFDEGLQEGYDRTTGAIKDTIKAPFKFTWDILPWPVLALAGVGLFIWLGGADWLRGRLNK